MEFFLIFILFPVSNPNHRSGPREAFRKKSKFSAFYESVTKLFPGACQAISRLHNETSPDVISQREINLVTIPPSARLNMHRSLRIHHTQCVSQNKPLFSSNIYLSIRHSWVTNDELTFKASSLLEVHFVVTVPSRWSKVSVVQAFLTTMAPHRNLKIMTPVPMSQHRNLTCSNSD